MKQMTFSFLESQNFSFNRAFYNKGLYKTCFLKFYVKPPAILGWSTSLLEIKTSPIKKLKLKWEV